MPISPREKAKRVQVPETTETQTGDTQAHIPETTEVQTDDTQAQIPETSEVQTGDTESKPPDVPDLPLYQFYLEKCVITDTRSVHEDSLIVGLGVIFTKGTTVSAPHVVCATLGDYNNTTFSFWDEGLGSLDGVAIEPDTNATFLYEIYNNGAKGHPNSDELTQLIGDHLKLQAAMNALQSSNPALAASLATQQQLDQLQQQISSAGSNVAASTASVTAGMIFTGGLYAVIYSVLEGCDGIVAAGSYSVDGTTLDQRLASSPDNVIRQTDTSNAKQNGWGTPCNPSGSNYLVSWVAQARGRGIPAVGFVIAA